MESGNIFQHAHSVFAKACQCQARHNAHADEYVIARTTLALRRHGSLQLPAMIKKIAAAVLLLSFIVFVALFGRLPTLRYVPCNIC